MTALCGGGTSSPKAGVSGTAIYSSGGLGLLGVLKNVKWLQAIAIPVGTLAYTVSELCATDPPAMPTFTFAEVLAAATGNFLVDDYKSFTDKLTDVLANAAWWTLCKCDSNPQPAQPTAPSDPGGYSVDSNPTQGLCIPMLASQVKVLNLWNGSTNVAPPANWQLETFDDSSWSYASIATPATVSTMGFPPSSGFSSTGTQFNLPCTSLPERVAPWTTPASGREQFLFRWHVNLPQFSQAALIASLVSEWESGGGWTTGLTYINSFPLGGVVSFNSNNWTNAFQYFKPGANVVASHVNNGNAGNAITWGTKGAVGMMLQQRSGNIPYTPSAGCCPPDPGIAALLAQLSTTVGLIQRQLAPFAYVIGPTHSSLSGSGSIACQGILGIAIDVGTPPARAGSEAGTPNTIYDIGWINFGTADGYVERHRIQNVSHVVFPNAAGVFTTIGYSIPVDVSVTITELLREP